MTPTTKPTTTGEPEQAGAAMDRRIHEKVMGRCVVHTLERDPLRGGDPVYICSKCGAAGFDYVTDYAGRVVGVQLYSTEDAAAMQVVERMKSLGFAFGCWDVPIISSVMPGPRAAFAPSVHPPEVGDGVSGRTLAEAICRAALAALAATGTGAGETNNHEGNQP